MICMHRGKRREKLWNRSAIATLLLRRWKQRIALGPALQLLAYCFGEGERGGHASEGCHPDDHAALLPDQMKLKGGTDHVPRKQPAPPIRGSGRNLVLSISLNSVGTLVTSHPAGSIQQAH